MPSADAAIANMTATLAELFEEYERRGPATPPGIYEAVAKEAQKWPGGPKLALPLRAGGPAGADRRVDAVCFWP